MLRLLIACGILMAVSEAEFNSKAGVTAVSLIRSNTEPPSGKSSNITGTVSLMMQTVLGGPPCTLINVNLGGLIPDTEHGFHIHQYGDIITNGCQSCGGHYNPFNQAHAGPADTPRYVGDLGNVMSDGDGNIVDVIRDCHVSLVGPHSVIGRAFVVHENRDDLGRGTGDAMAGSLTTGNAGARLGCGVIIHAPVIG